MKKQVLIRVEVESYDFEQKVLTYAGVPHIGCNEMWVGPAFWQHSTEKVKQYMEQKTTKVPPSAVPQGGGRFAPAPLGLLFVRF